MTLPATDPPTPDLSLELRDLVKRYGDATAVDGVSLAVPAGSIFGLLGPNGAGKTTTLRMVMDIIAPDAGEVLLGGRPRRPGDLSRIGYLPEERGLYRKMTVLDHLAFLGELHGLAGRDARQRAAGWLDRLGLGERARSKVEELSKGMQQKLQLAGTVLHEPELLILDEPFSGLDPINQGQFKELLAEHRARGRTILFSTHVMEQAEKLCDHIGLISRGRVVLAGELAAIKRRLGGNSFRLRARGEVERIRELPEVEQVVGTDGLFKLLLAPTARGPEVLRRLVERVEVEEFRSQEPDLEEIFIKAVNDAG